MYYGRTVIDLLSRTVAWPPGRPVSNSVGDWQLRVLVVCDRGYTGAVSALLPCAAGHQVGGLGLGLHEDGTRP